ncbi:MAG TPA: AAA family ATPase [Phycisphaerae bacterium]|nr:AAA family ATPase [Phycisphaerae bacterium]HOJ75285.1 AAA family ATPase [Phycisphaerae bacterium]HOM53050.1 AAA family ATPase [Phycisphaerae bacterium]HON66987.1 AAA family ATPase [Phycisphaerae bacterium]HOQ88210.1 AAA family ATPase [Phycisphaerae bacterium]
MRRIAVINQKGGVGKTTTSVNVGAGLARAGHRVLLIDLDPQAHLTLHLGLNPAEGRPGVYELLTGTTTLSAARTQVSNNLWVVGASIDLAAAEVELVSIVGREVILRDLIDQHVEENGGADPYDYVVMDCPPSLGVLTLNGLCAAKEVVLPLQPHYLALQGLSKLFETVSLVGKRINPELTVTGVVICMKEAGTRLGAEVVEDVRGFLEAARNTPVPWRNARVFETAIRRNIKLAEAPSYGQSIFDYAADSNGAKDYEALAAEIHDPVAFAARSQAQSQTVAPAEPATPPESVAPAEPTAPAESAGAGESQSDASAVSVVTDSSAGSEAQAAPEAQVMPEAVAASEPVVTVETPPAAEPEPQPASAEPEVVPPAEAAVEPVQSEPYSSAILPHPASQSPQTDAFPPPSANLRVCG